MCIYIYIYICLFAEISCFFPLLLNSFCFANSFYAVAGLCALLPEKICGFWLPAGVAGGSETQRLFTENICLLTNERVMISWLLSAVVLCDQAVSVFVSAYIHTLYVMDGDG